MNGLYMVLVRDNQRKRVRKESMNRINGFLREEDIKIGVLKSIYNLMKMMANK